MLKKLNQLIESKETEQAELNFNLSLFNFLIKKYPDCQYSITSRWVKKMPPARGYLEKKEVNYHSNLIDINNCEINFENNAWECSLYIIENIIFDYNGIQFPTKITTAPSKINIIKTAYSAKQGTYLKFNKISPIFKKLKLPEKLLKTSLVEACQLIKTYPKYKVDTSNLNKKLIKLLTFM